ncbi:MAG: chromosomal replication initiator protein DnaA [Ruminococcaceae bacterium]|nr:chromosomal replication initiator protein DnaA [Oscillospiraceae bacterium]
MNTFKNVWKKCLEIFNEDSQINPVSMNLWIKELVPVELQENYAVFYVSASFQRDVVYTRYGDLIKTTLSELMGFDVELKIYTADDKPENLNIEDADAPDVAETGVLDNVEKDFEYSFDNFVVGASNRFAHAASVAVAKNPANAYNPLFIHGASGLGKTHLLHAIRNEVKKNFKDFNIMYITCEEFANELISAIKNATTHEFREKYRKVDFLLIDDIQFIGNTRSTQEEFFHTFNTLYEANKQIVLVSDRPPREIQLLDERLCSRFVSGLTADINSPDYELRMAIISRKAELLKFKLPDDVVQFIATRLKNNIRQLEGAVKKTMAYYLLTGVQPSIAVAQSAIKDILNENEPLPITIDKIITEVSHFYHISPEDIKGKKRTADITLARQVAMYMIREITQLSLPAIGEEFSGRDHSTVHHAINKVEDDMARNTGFKAIVNDLIKNVRER